MNPAFFYQVSGRMFRSFKNETNPIEINKVFKDENPIIAREQAFNYYQSFIDVLLESKGKNYISHAESEKELQDFFNSYERKKVKISGEILENMELDTDCDKGLGISLIMSDSKSFLNAAGHTIYENSHLIHYIDNQFTDLKPFVFEELLLEYSLYKKYAYDCKNNIISKLATSDYFLKTPIDFIGHLS